MRLCRCSCQDTVCLETQMMRRTRTRRKNRCKMMTNKTRPRRTIHDCLGRWCELTVPPEDNETVVWKHMQRITQYNVPDREIKADCTHICVCPLSDDEEGSKSYCNTPLKLLRCTKSVSSEWITSVTVAHFKKQHPHSNVAHKQKGKLEMATITQRCSMVLA